MQVALPRGMPIVLLLFALVVLSSRALFGGPPSIRPSDSRSTAATREAAIEYDSMSVRLELREDGSSSPLVATLRPFGGGTSNVVFASTRKNEAWFIALSREGEGSRRRLRATIYPLRDANRDLARLFVSDARERDRRSGVAASKAGFAVPP